jgi:hypothetical protein
MDVAETLRTKWWRVILPSLLEGCCAQVRIRLSNYSDIEAFVPFLISMAGATTLSPSPD